MVSCCCLLPWVVSFILMMVWFKQKPQLSCIRYSISKMMLGSGPMDHFLYKFIYLYRKHIFQLLFYFK
ncbi:unnamed protein product [Coffea canephora]|uniref:Uncharacterized protein n=1 Tax=Coffea canephora TaxID=49390 RepID=A0A068TP26_COFCA|nr:unnamed protein product [Coffea canephora]